MRFLEEYQIDNLYVHLDTFHMGIDECDPVKAIERCAGHIGYFHLADNSRRYPGTGQFDFVKILKALETAGYNGYLSVECLPWPDELEAAKQAIAYMKQVEQKLKLTIKPINKGGKELCLNGKSRQLAATWRPLMVFTTRT